MPITFSSFDTLPAALQDYLDSDVLSQVNNEIFDTYGIPDEQCRLVLDVVLNVFLGKVSLEKFPHALSAVVGKSPQEITPLAAEMALRVLQPASEYLGPVEAYVRRWSEDAVTKKYTPIVPALTLPKYTREEIIARFIELRPRSVSHPKAVLRYEKLMEEIVYRGRSNFDEAQFRTALVGKIEEGGVGLSALDADQMLLLIKREFAASNTLRPVVRKPDAAAPKEEAAAQKQVTKDIEQATRTVREKLGPSAGAHMPAEELLLNEVVEKIKQSKPQAVSDELTKVLEARIKNMRDTRATMDVLMRTKEQGGLGIDSDTAMLIISTVEEALHAQTQQQTIKHQPVSAPQQTQPPSSEDAQKAQPVDASFTRAIGGASQKDWETAEKLLGTQKQLGATHEDNVRAVAPAKVPVIEQPVEQPYVFQKEKPRLEDVRKVVTLTGPVQEIESLRLVDFRRSAPTADIRIEKILSAVQRIGEESYTDKIQAIYAWRRSEPYQLYEEMLIEALRDKKPLIVVTQERIKSRRAVLDKDEFAAILRGHTSLEDW